MPFIWLKIQIFVTFNNMKKHDPIKADFIYDLF